MARSKRIKETAAGVANYHVIARTNNRQFLFSSPKTKDALVDALKRAAAFSGVGLEAYAIMDNHVHVVARVTRPECSIAAMGPVPNSDAPQVGPVPNASCASDQSEAGENIASWREIGDFAVSPMGPVPSLAEVIPEAELLRRVGILKGEKAQQDLEEEWQELRKAGLVERLEQEQNHLRVRMNDVSEFVKTFKETFDRIYKKDHDYCGSIWSGRFYSTLVEDGEYLARCRKYVFYNPVRAGIVTRAASYSWSYDRAMIEAGENAVCACETADFATPPTGPVPSGGGAAAGSVPRGWWMRKVAQIGAGKVFGSAAFVMRKASGLGHLFPAKRVVARAVGEIGFATHGWKLAKADEARRSRVVA